MAMGLSHVYVRLPGSVDVAKAVGDAAQSVQCAHEDFGTGAVVTEALVSGAGAKGLVKREFPHALAVVDVRCPAWVEQSILGVGDRGEPAMATLHALRAPEEEWDLVTHPHALSGAALVRRCASRMAAQLS
jgi:hypothetical protein